MNIPNRFDIPKYISMIEDKDLREKIKSIYLDLRANMEYYPASTKYHHKDFGGHGDHTAQVMELSINIYNSLKESCADFNLDDVILVAFVHDLDKLWRYQQIKERKEGGPIFEYKELEVPYDEYSKTIAECFRRGLELKDIHIEAIDHHHGGWAQDLSSVYNYRSKNIGKLATILHCADMLSCSLWGGKI